MSTITRCGKLRSLAAGGALLVTSSQLVAACAHGDGSEDTAEAMSSGAAGQSDTAMSTGNAMGSSSSPAGGSVSPGAGTQSTDTANTSAGGVTDVGGSDAASGSTSDAQPSDTSTSDVAQGADMNTTDDDSQGAGMNAANADSQNEMAADDSSGEMDDATSPDDADAEMADIGASGDDEMSAEGEQDGTDEMPGGGEDLEPFSFFVSSMEGMQRLSGSDDGFGGDLRYGEDDGLAGADKICTELAEYSMPGASQKQWRAFLSVNSGPEGSPLNAIDRIGEGPWYDRLGRVVAMSKSDLLNPRPEGADPMIINDLPNEYGVPNSDPDGTGGVDNHHVLTGSGEDGTLFNDVLGDTCNDWTSAVGDTGNPQSGFSWPRGGGGGGGGGFGGGGFGGGGGGGGNGTHWITGFLARGCEAGISIIQDGGGDENILTVGEGGGYGAIYCFALTP